MTTAYSIITPTRSITKIAHIEALLSRIRILARRSARLRR